MAETICLGIIHAAHEPARHKLLERLSDQLTPLPREVIAHRVHGERGTPREWARISWRWAFETGAEFSVILNDDVVLAPCFWPALLAMLETFPARTVLGLGTVSPGQKDARNRGDRWLRDGHGVVGWAVGMWRAELGLLVEAESTLPPDHRSGGHDECKPGCTYWHEDSWTNDLLESLEIPVWHPVPSIVDHDTSLPSLYGNDHHKCRTAPVTWRDYDLTSPEYWKP
jgi:hypothetical protein